MTQKQKLKNGRAPLLAAERAAHEFVDEVCEHAELGRVGDELAGLAELESAELDFNSANSATST